MNIIIGILFFYLAIKAYGNFATVFPFILVTYTFLGSFVVGTISPYSFLSVIVAFIFFTRYNRFFAYYRTFPFKSTVFLFALSMICTNFFVSARYRHTPTLVFNICQSVGYTYILWYLLQNNAQKTIHALVKTALVFGCLVSIYALFETITRSNPGLLLIKDGRIINKWSHNDLPSEETQNKPLEQTEIGKIPNDTVWGKILEIVLWFILPLMLLTIADRILAWGKWVRNKEKEDKDKIYQLFNKKKNKMRKKIVAGNWKMNMNLQDGVALAKEINEALVADKPNCGVVICTPFIHLASVAQVLDQNVVGLGAEDCADKEKGAFTGEVSAEMVKSTGAQYVILGHSERRQYYGETAEILKEKVQLALKNGLKIIFCCGETLEEREANKQNEVVKAELADSVFNLSEEEWKNIILAYEPIWAIGTGKTATSDQAEEMLAYIRSIVAEKYGKNAAEDTTILYGGSCKASNAPELFSKPNIDGGLIGGASLKTADFKGIIDAWKK